MTKWLTIFLSVLGLALAGYVVATSGEEPPDSPPAATPTVNPFADGIAASGTVEASTRNLSINAPVGGLVVEVMADVGARVEAGEALFRLDARELEAQLPGLEAALVQAEAEVSRLRSMPRPETLPPLRAALARAEANLADVEDWYRTLEAAREDQAATPKEIKRAWFAVETARAEVEAARAELRLTEAGAWDVDIQVGESRVALARAEAGAVRSLIERLTVRAPVAGVVLKRNIEPGRFTTTDPNDPALVVGNLDELHVRARVDEEDLPRLHEGARAFARVRGAATKQLPLVWRRVEPLAIPKTSLTGSVTERVDTRVVEVIFLVGSREGMRLYPGQVVDVYIDASSPETPGG